MTTTGFSSGSRGIQSVSSLPQRSQRLLAGLSAEDRLIEIGPSPVDPDHWNAIALEAIFAVALGPIDVTV